MKKTEKKRKKPAVKKMTIKSLKKYNGGRPISCWATTQEGVEKEEFDRKHDIEVPGTTY